MSCRNLHVGIFSAILLLAASSVAHAQRGRKIESVRFDVHLDLGFHGAFGIGGRADIPIVPDGLIEGVDDELAISPGIDVFFYSFSRYCHRGVCYAGDQTVAIWPLIAAQWNFYINELWSLFPELGLVMLINDDYYYYGYYDDDVYYADRAAVYIRPFISFGARYHFNDRNALLFRIGWPAGLQVGITF